MTFTSSGSSYAMTTDMFAMWAPAGHRWMTHSKQGAGLPVQFVKWLDIPLGTFLGRMLDGRLRPFLFDPLSENHWTIVSGPITDPGGYYSAGNMVECTAYDMLEAKCKGLEDYTQVLAESRRKLEVKYLDLKAEYEKLSASYPMQDKTKRSLKNKI